MGGDNTTPTGPDLGRGIPVNDLTDGGLLAGHVGQKPVLLARLGSEWFAIDPVCSHYSGPLPEGLMVGDTVRCPWHHACFSLRTGEALRAPALDHQAGASTGTHRRGVLRPGPRHPRVRLGGQHPHGQLFRVW